MCGRFQPSDLAYNVFEKVYSASIPQDSKQHAEKYGFISQSNDNLDHFFLTAGVVLYLGCRNHLQVLCGQYEPCSVKKGLNPLPNDKILDRSNLKAFTDDISNVVQMMICVTDLVENIVGKGEIADYHNVFKRLLSQGHLKSGLYGKELMHLQKVSILLTTLGKKPFENIIGKGENAGNQHFLLFPCFLPNQ